MSFEWEAVRVFYADRAVLVQAAVAYLGMVLYRALATISDARQRAIPRVASAIVVVFFFGAFPLPARPFSPWLMLQHVAAVGALVALGPVLLHGVLLDFRGMRAGGGRTALTRRELLLLYAPAAVVLGMIQVDVARLFPAFTGDPARGGGLADQLATWNWIRGATTIVVYMLVAAPFAIRTRRALRDVRLDAVERWSAMTAAAATLWGGVVVATYLALGPDARASHHVRLGMYLLALGPGLVELRWAYDAALRRILAFHVLLVLAAVQIVGGMALVTHLGLVAPVSWAVVLMSVAGSSQVLPQVIESWLERGLFPSAAIRRLRLAEIGAAPLPGTRAETVVDVLQRVVEAIDCEGGIVVVQPTATEPASTAAVRWADPAPLGATPADAARYLASLRLGRSPHDVRSLPLPDRIRLASCDVTIVCPLAGARLEGVLLLGPRRGWPYDEVTLDGLEALGRNLGLALENLTLLGERLTAERTLAHHEKLAALGEAAARIAHEIRNPLTAARSLVQQAGQSEGAAPLAEPALGELDRIGRLVTDLLAFARPDDVRGRDPIDLVDVCRDALAQVHALATASGVTIEGALPAASVTVRGDRDRLVQVVGNLCRNAVEAMAEAPAPRRVLVRCTGGSGHAVLEVQDRGHGIPAEELPRLFEPFRTTKSSGTGLGLPIARKIVEAHGGRLVAESRPGVETTFRVELPLVASSAAA